MSTVRSCVDLGCSEGLYARHLAARGAARVRRRPQPAVPRVGPSPGQSAPQRSISAWCGPPPNGSPCSTAASTRGDRRQHERDRRPAPPRSREAARVLRSGRHCSSMSLLRATTRTGPAAPAPPRPDRDRVPDRSSRPNVEFASRRAHADQPTGAPRRWHRTTLRDNPDWAGLGAAVGAGGPDGVERHASPGITFDTMGVSTVQITVTVNGTAHTSEVEPRTLLVHYIREALGLTGTNIGCDTSSCGACTVHVDGESVKSCTMLAVQADGSDDHHDRGPRRRRRDCTRCSRRSWRTTACSAATAPRAW